jgi:hypothetical protein
MTYSKIHPIIEFLLFKIFCISLSDETEERIENINS